MAGGSCQKERNAMIELVLAFVLAGPVDRPVVGAPVRVAVSIVGSQPVRGVLGRVAKARPVRRALSHRCPVRRAARLVAGRR